MRSEWRFAVALLAYIAPACGSDGAGNPGGTIEGLTAIDVTPADQTLIIDGSNSATSDYQALGHFQDGHQEDITDLVLFSVEDPLLGRFTGKRFASTTSRGGVTRVF